MAAEPGTNNLQRTVDSLERTLRMLTDRISGMAAVSNAAKTGLGGTYGGSQTSGRPNGGGATFGGQAFAPGGGTHRAGPGQPAPTPTSTPGGAHRAPVPNGGNYVMAAAAGASAYRGATWLDSHLGQAPAAQQDSRHLHAALGTAANMNMRLGNGGVNTVKNFGNGFAMNDEDSARSLYTTYSSSGYTLGSSGFQRFGNQASMHAAINPLINLDTAASVNASWQSPNTFNQMATYGINTMVGGKSQGVTGIASQLIARGNYSAKSKEGVKYLTGHGSSPLNQTLSSMVRSGALSQDQADGLRSAVETQLLADVTGNSAAYEKYKTDMENAAPGQAKEITRAFNEATGLLDSPLTRKKFQEGEERKGTLQDLDTFTTGLDRATEGLENFSKFLNSFNEKTGLGNAWSFFKGLTDQGPMGAMAGMGSLSLSVLGASPMGTLLSEGANVLGALNPFGGPANIHMGAQNAFTGATGMGSPTGGYGYMAMGGTADSGAGSGSGGGGGKGGGVGSVTTGGSSIIKPVNGPITAKFGAKHNCWGSGRHDGVDIKGSVGTTVRSAFAGKVVSSNAAGVLVKNDVYVALYLHVSSSVKKGQSVTQGQAIGTIGKPAKKNQAPHLHFTLYHGSTKVDPEKYFGGANVGSGATTGSGVMDETPRGFGSGAVTSSAFSGGSASAGIGSGTSTTTASVSMGGGGGGFSGTSEAAIVAGALGGAGMSAGGGTMTMTTETSTMAISGGGGGGGGGGATTVPAAPGGSSTSYPSAAGLGGVKPWVAWAAGQLKGKYPGLVKSMGGVGDRGYYSDHTSGHAVDFMTGTTKPNAWALANYARANAHSLGVTYVIYYRKIWSVARNSEGWRPYGSTPDGNTSPTALHMDHVHVSFIRTESPGYIASKKGGGVQGGGTPEQNRALGQKMAAARGWTGQQWNALESLWTKESGWNHQADNPTSSAYGIPQALIALHKMPAGYYGSKSGSGSSTKASGGRPGVQIEWGLNYIKGRYGSPSAALGFHQKNGWYDSGAWEIQEDETARLHRGEMVIPANPAQQIRDVLLHGNSYGSAKGGGGGGIVFQRGAFQIHVSGVNGGDQIGRAIGRGIEDQLRRSDRIKELMG